MKHRYVRLAQDPFLDSQVNFTECYIYICLKKIDAALQELQKHFNQN